MPDSDELEAIRAVRDILTSLVQDAVISEQWEEQLEDLIARYGEILSVRSFEQARHELPPDDAERIDELLTLLGE